MKTRILQFIKLENKSAAQLADEIGVQPSSISHIISGRNNPSLDFVMKMLTKFPSLSSDWLLFGKGEMFRNPQINGLFDTISDQDSGKFTIIEEFDKSPLSDRTNADSKNRSGLISEDTSRAFDKKAVRIVYFFADNTFKEYFAEDELIS